MATSKPNLGGLGIQFTEVKFDKKDALAKAIGYALVKTAMPIMNERADKLRADYRAAGAGEKNHAPGKNDWKKSTADRFEVVQGYEDGKSFVGLKFKDNLSQAERVQTMLVEYGSGSKAANGGQAIYFGPAGRIVWNDELTGTHKSGYGWSEHQYYRRSNWSRWRKNQGLDKEEYFSDYLEAAKKEYVYKKVYLKEIHIKDDGTKVEAYKLDANGKRMFRQYWTRKVHKRAMNPRGFKAPNEFNQTGLRLIDDWVQKIGSWKNYMINKTAQMEVKTGNITRLLRESYKNIVT